MKHLLRIALLSIAAARLAAPAGPVSPSAVTCPSSGAKRLASSSHAAALMTIQSVVGNAGTIYIGDSTVSSSSGIALIAGDSYTFGPAGNANPYNPYQTYIACSNSNDSVTYIYQ